MAPITWSRNPPPLRHAATLSPLAIALGRGLLCRCPVCGEPPLFKGYLRVVSECRHCGASLGLARADDAPPYFTVFAVGHIIVLLLFMFDRGWNPPIWLECATFLPLTLIMTLVLLRPIKGGTVGLMLKLGMVKTGADS